MDLFSQYDQGRKIIYDRLKTSLSRPKGDSTSTLGQERIREAMAYTLLGDGKRLRPLLALETARSCASHLDRQTAYDLATPAALALEYVHTYSLIHDDLPAMDDDGMRRGKPSCHRQFDEATAVLTGDALLSDAFWLLAQARVKAAQQCVELAAAIGSQGMVQGQMDDLLLSSGAINESRVLDVHYCKTAKLFACACVLGAMSVDASQEVIHRLRQYGSSFGMAFQLVDDLLDEGDFVKCVGTERATQLAEQQIAQALQALEPLGERARSLIDLAQITLKRTF